MTDPAADMSKLRGRTILIAESSPLIALDLAETISAWGAHALLHHDLPVARRRGPFVELAAALVDVSVSSGGPDCLIEMLQQSGVPVVITTSWGVDSARRDFPGLPVFDKPTDFAALAHWFAGLDR